MAVTTPSDCTAHEIPRLASLWRHLDGLESHSPESLGDALSRLRVDLAGWLPFTRFDAARYCRRSVRLTDAYEALLMGWLPGQSSLVHDHRGSACAFRVLEGTATEHTYTFEESRLLHVGEHDLPTGSVVASREPDIHALANCGGRQLVTLHVYSPPLTQMRIYEVERDLEAEVA